MTAGYGLLRLDGEQLALPLDVLREVVPRPAALVPLPVVAPGLVGALDLRGQVIPVVDLRLVLGREATVARDQVIAVLQAGGLGLGLVADAVNGVTAADAHDLQAMTAQGADLFVRALFRHPQDGSVVTVLDVERLMGLPGVPRTIDAGALETGDDARTAATGTAVPAVLLRCGDVHVAVAASDVHSVLPALTPQPSPMQGPLCTGVTTVRGVQVATVDLMRLLDLGSLEPGRPTQAMLLQLAEGMVALQVGQVLDVVALALPEAAPLPPGTVRRPDLFSGVLPHPRLGQVLVLDVPSVSAHPDLAAMAALNQPEPSTGPARATNGAVPAQRPRPVAAAGRPASAGPTGHTGNTDSAGNAGGGAGGAHLTYLLGDRGTLVASPLHHVGEIIAFPHEHAIRDAGSEPVIGLFVHRGRPVPLACLAAVLGVPATVDPQRDRVLLVGEDGERVGFVVRALQAIETVVWREEEGGRTAQDAGASSGRSRLAGAPLLELAHDPAARDRGSERLVPEVDLLRLAAEVLGTASPLALHN